MALSAVFLIIAIYNVIVFVIPFARGGGFWTGYGFSMLAMLLTAGIIHYAFGRESLQSKVYGIPLMSVAFRYLLVQVVVGFLEMILTFVPYRYTIALNAILLGVCLLGLIVVDAAKEAIERIDKKVGEKVFFIRALQADVEGIVARTTNGSMKKVLRELVDTIRYSDPMSNPQLAAIENKIEARVADLMETVGADSDAAKALCDELQQLFADRNRKAKMLK